MRTSANFSIKELKPMNEPTPRIVGVFEWSDAKDIHIQAKFDKVALHDNRLVFISLVAFSQDIKAIRAASYCR